MELLASIQIGYLDQDYEVDSDEKKNERKKMLSLQRKAFIHEDLSANESFSLKAQYIYIRTVSF